MLLHFDACGAPGGSSPRLFHLVVLKVAGRGVPVAPAGAGLGGAVQKELAAGFTSKDDQGDPIVEPIFSGFQGDIFGISASHLSRILLKLNSSHHLSIYLIEKLIERIRAKREIGRARRAGLAALLQRRCSRVRSPLLRRVS